MIEQKVTSHSDMNDNAYHKIDYSIIRKCYSTNSPQLFQTKLVTVSNKMNNSLIFEIFTLSMSIESVPVNKKFALY